MVKTNKTTRSRGKKSVQPVWKRSKLKRLTPVLIIILVAGALGVWKLIDTYAASPYSVNVKPANWKKLRNVSIKKIDGNKSLLINAKKNGYGATHTGSQKPLNKLVSFQETNHGKKAKLCVKARHSGDNKLHVSLYNMSSNYKVKSYKLNKSYKNYCFDFKVKDFVKSGEFTANSPYIELASTSLSGDGKPSGTITVSRVFIKLKQ